MLFLIPKNKKFLLYFIIIIIIGIFLEYKNIIETEKFIGFCIIFGILYYVIRTLLVGYCSQKK